MPSSPQFINSRDNSLLRLVRRVREGKEQELIFIEGLRLCEEALRTGMVFEALIYSDQIAEKERAARFIKQATEVSQRLATVSENLLATVSYTKTPQGIIALARRPNSGPEVISERTPPALLVVLHGINNPVNVGAILRSAEAAGATGVIATSRTSDPFSPKSLRGAMGSAFRLPIWFGASYGEALRWCSERGIETVCADLDGETPYTAKNWKKPCALIVGPEANGLTREEVAAADSTISIPMHGEVESLNVGVAAAIALYEAARQRQESQNTLG